MGITGLLPFLEKKTARRVSLQELSGSTAAVDTYCWLHKGVFTCADKLAMNLETDGYVTYCMSNIEVLLKFKIKPILVFDGRHLPAKAETEAKRRENRETNRKKAMELIQMGEHHKGVNMLKRTIDVSHAMALDVMRKCQELNIDCIAAPYEADSQLAYLNISGIADFVITEDSDLTLFGCSKILFKMDRGNGCGTLVEQDKLHLSMGLRPEEFTIDKFRHMCILSGCDYLPSLPGIGLVKALKFAQKNTDENLYNALGRLGTYINKSISVSPEYRESFIRALLTFKHQLVYCPIRRKQVRLSEPSDDVTPEQLHYAGDPVDEELAYQLALGNCNPFGFKKMNNFDPDTRAPFSRKATRWSKYAVLDLPSIWSKEFKLKTTPMGALTSETKKCPEAQAKIQKIDMYIPKKKFSPREVKNNVEKKTATPKKRSSQHFDNELSKDDLMKLYGNPKMMRSEDKKEKPKIEEKKEEKFASPKKVNPFLKRPVCSETSPSLVPRGRRRPKITTIGFQPTIVDETIVTESRFFSGSGCSKENDERAVIIPETLDVLHEDYAPRNLAKEIDIQDELAQDGVTKIQKNVINTEDLCKVPVSDDVAPSMTLDQEEYEKNMLNFEEIRTVDHRTPRNSIDGQVEGDVIIPETPDDEPESSSSQSSCKENDNINVQIKQLDLDQSLSRSDSGVDMKECDGAEKNLNQPVSPVVTNTPESRRQSSGLNITIRKYGLKSPAEKVERPPSPEDLEELFGTSQPINNSTSNFFRWGNTSRNDKPVNFLSSQQARTSQKKPSSQSKRRGPIAKKLPKPDSQQSVLNMFGFGRTKI